MSDDVTQSGALEALAIRLSAGPVSDNAVHAVIDGTPVIVRYTLHSVGSSSTKWTEIGVTAQDAAGTWGEVTFDIRPAQPFDAAEVRSGFLRDLIIGDPAFDEAFVVEAAPQDVVRTLFADAIVRAEMLALLPIHLYSSKEFVFQIAREGWVVDVDVLERCARLAVRLGASLGSAADEAAEARRRQPVGGYREGPPTLEDIQRERAADMRAFDEQRARRRRRDLRFVMGLIAAILFAVIAIIVVSAKLSSH